MLPLDRDPSFEFRFAEDRILPRFHLEGVEPGTQVRVIQDASESFATVGEGGWVDLLETIVVRAGGAFSVVPEGGGR